MIRKKQINNNFRLLLDRIKSLRKMHPELEELLAPLTVGMEDYFEGHHARLKPIPVARFTEAQIREVIKVLKASEGIGKKSK